MPEPIADLFNALLKALLAAEQEDKKTNDLESLVSNAGQDDAFAAGVLAIGSAHEEVVRACVTLVEVVKDSPSQ
jgi:erythromycin esterase-like protein